MNQLPGDRSILRPRRERSAPRRASPVHRWQAGAARARQALLNAPGAIRYAIVAGALLAVTGLLWPVRQQIGLLNAGLILLIVVIGATTLAGRGAGIFASFVAFALFDYFLVPPYLTFEIGELRNTFALFVFLGVSTLISALLARASEQAEQAQQRAEDFARLYELSRSMIGAQDTNEVLQTIVDSVAGVFEANSCWIFLPERSRLVVARRSSSGTREPTRDEMSIAEWVFRTGSEVKQNPADRGRFAGQERGQGAAFAPLKGGAGILGVLAVADKSNSGNFTSAEQTVLNTFAGHAAIALERLRLLQEANRAEMLDRTSELKSALMSAVSHDLRTPLASIMASVTSLLDSEVQWDEETRQDFLQGIYDEARRLNRLVGNLLDMSRIEGGALKPEKNWYSIAEVVEAVLERMEPVLAACSLSTDVDIDDGLPLLLFDFSEIDQVITNLLENAARYAPPGSAIEIRVKELPGYAEVSIADTGPGVPAADLPHLFDKFYRAGNGTHSKGAGLGLAICKGLVEAHGGRIGAANRPGGGLVVSFALPLGEAGSIVKERSQTV